MPVTARFSRRFYDTLGDEVASEFVDWFNAVDSTYRSDLNRINDLNFARFDAKVDQRFAEFDAKFEKRFAEQDAKWERRLVELDAKWSARIEQVRTELIDRIAALEVRVERRLYLVLATQVAFFLGLWFK